MYSRAFMVIPGSRIITHNGYITSVVGADVVYRPALALARAAMLPKRCMGRCSLSARAGTSGGMLPKHCRGRCRLSARAGTVGRHVAKAL